MGVLGGNTWCKPDPRKGGGGPQTTPPAGLSAGGGGGGSGARGRWNMCTRDESARERTVWPLCVCSLLFCIARMAMAAGPLPKQRRWARAGFYALPDPIIPRERRGCHAVKVGLPHLLPKSPKSKRRQNTNKSKSKNKRKANFLARLTVFPLSPPMRSHTPLRPLCRPFPPLSGPPEARPRETTRP